MRFFVTAFLSLHLLLLWSACAQNRNLKQEAKTSTDKDAIYQAIDLPFEQVHKTEEEWKALLTAEEYRVTREKGTERSFTGKYWNNKENGIYTCVCCKLPLFTANKKYKSGTGWPSFWKPIKSQHVKEETDTNYGWNRVEVLCNRCDAHLGHVFNDGPPPTGLRYCINSASLDFEPARE